jgi:hypothetical protein
VIVSPTKTLRTGDGVALQADNQLYWSRINCDNTDTIEAAKSGINAFCRFVANVPEHSRIALQADNGMYLSRINRGSTNPIEAAKLSIDPFCLFTVTTLSNAELLRG